MTLLRQSKAMQTLNYNYHRKMFTSVWRIFRRFATTNKCQIVASKQHFHMSDTTISKVCTYV